MCREPAASAMFCVARAPDTLGHKSPCVAGYKADIANPEGESMKRLFAILAFVAGGFAAELHAPLQCTLLHVSAGRVSRKRREV